MYRGIHEVIYGGGAQPLVHVPSVRVASATYVVEDLMVTVLSDEREIVAGTAATVDTFSAELSEDAGPEEGNPRRIAVDDATGAVVGTAYSIESEAGESEIFVASGVGSGYLMASAPLSGQYGAGSEVRGVQLSGTFPSGAAGTESLFDEDRPIRVLWTYAISGRTVTVQEQVRLVRSRGEDVGLTSVENDLRENWPELCKEYGGSLAALVKYASRRVQARLRKRNLDPGQVLLGDAGHDVILARALLHFADQGVIPNQITPSDFHEQRKATYLAELDALTTGRAGRNQVDVTREDDVSNTSHSRRYGSITVRP